MCYEKCRFGVNSSNRHFLCLVHCLISFWESLTFLKNFSKVEGTFEKYKTLALLPESYFYFREVPQKTY
jgi:hypothetical protein